MQSVTLQDLRLYDEAPITYIVVDRDADGCIVEFCRLHTVSDPHIANIYFGFETPATYGEFMYKVLITECRDDKFSHCFMKIGKSYWAYEKGDAHIYKLPRKPEVFCRR